MIKSESFRKIFILEFTKEIIRNTNSYREEIIKQKIKKSVSQKNLSEELPKRENLREVVNQKLNEDKKKFFILKKNDLLEKNIPKKIIEFKIEEKNPFQKFPFLTPPTKIQKPNPQKEFRISPPNPIFAKIDLRKLNSLIRDPLVKTIECQGSTEKIIVEGPLGRKNTNIILSKEEIKEIIDNFSKETKIPVQEGIFKVILERLSFLAVISETIDSKFLITKLPLQKYSQPPIPSYLKK